MAALRIRHNIPLAPYTSLKLGGSARYLLEVDDESTLVDALEWSKRQDLPIVVLGGGSNVVLSDQGWPGIVLHIVLRGLVPTYRANEVHIRVAAGEPWDPLVEHSVAQGWAGLECLSGIPGSTGATPIQNVGAYGQEVSQVITAVHIWDRFRAERRIVPADACRFGYRDSVFKRKPDTAIVLAVDFVLRPGGSPTLRYPELRHQFDRDCAPSLAQVRAQVLDLRRRKSMVIEAGDPNRRSAGSFFTNVLLTPPAAEALYQRAVDAGIVHSAEAVPRYRTEDGHIKIPAAWLIEAVGFRKGERYGAVGISSRHALALVHHGGGTSQQLRALAQRIQDRVRTRLGVELHPEPVFVGFDDIKHHL